MAHQIVSRALVLLCIMLQGADRAQGAGSRQRHTKTAFALRTSLPSAPGAPRRARREGVRAAAGTGCTRLVRRAGLPATRSAAQRRHVLAYGRGRARLAGWALRSHCSASTLRPPRGLQGGDRARAAPRHPGPQTMYWSQTERESWSLNFMSNQPRHPFTCRENQ